MDLITKSLLDEFSVAAEISSLSEDKRFEHFACYLTVERLLAENFDTADIVTGDGGDTGIDGIAIIVNGSLIDDASDIEDFEKRNNFLDVTFVFIQAERSSSFDSSKIGQFGFGVSDFFRERPTLPANAAIKSALAVKTEVYRRASAFRRGNPVCKLYYVTTGTWVGDKTLEARRQAFVDDLVALRQFREVELVPIDANTIQRWYRESKNSVSREFDFPRRTVLPKIPNVNEAYLGLLPARDFLTLVENEDGAIIKSIFYDNVRDWQEYNKVNSEMRDTLSSETTRSRFAIMNNGVTIIAKTLRITGDRFCIEDYQVVNGCQTSHVLHDQEKEELLDVAVPLRLISTNDEEVIASIIKATNRQTEVKEEQLLAVSDFQKKIEAYFSAFPESHKRLYYERRSRQFNNVAGIEQKRIITPRNLIRAFASMFLETPHRTTRSYKDILEGIGRNIFVETDRVEPYYVSAFAFYRLEFLFRNQIESRFKAARFQILLAFRLLSTSEPPPQMNSRAMERYCNQLTEVLWDTTRAESVFMAAKGVVEQVSKGNLDSDFLRTLPFTQALKSTIRRG